MAVPLPLRAVASVLALKCKLDFGDAATQRGSRSTFGYGPELTSWHGVLFTKESPSRDCNE